MAKRRKKLIEVALPLEAINKASAREKSIRHGHPSTLHLWWARRPLAACRAVLFAQFVDDPDSDPCYIHNGVVDEEAAGLKRAELFNLIEELVIWENANNPKVINAARREIARCVASRKIELGELKKTTIIFGPDEGKDHTDGEISNQGLTAYEVVLMQCKPEVVNHFLATYAPPVLDPFCGGGSIPLEAQRLGLRAHASDLNPVPVLINKALIEIPPKFANMPPVSPEAQKALGTATYRGAEGLAEDVRYYGKWMRDEAEKRIGDRYPKVEITEEIASARPDLAALRGEKLTVVSWLWARTVASPDPAVGGQHIPLIKSFRLCDRKGRDAWLHPNVDRDSNTYDFQVRKSPPTLRGTIGRKGAQCLISGTPVPFKYIRAEGKAGRIGTMLVAVVLDAPCGRVFLASGCLKEPPRRDTEGDEVISGELAFNPFAVRPPLYGFTKFADLFTARQRTALATFSDLLASVRFKVSSRQGSEEYAVAVITYLAFAISKCADYWNSVATWMPRGTVGHAFSKQAIPMTFDFPEANPFADFHCCWERAVSWVAKVLDSQTLAVLPGSVSQADARVERADTFTGIVSTDPPYYSNIDYADLSDFFYVWLRRSLAQAYPMLFATIATPKSEELVATPYRFDGSKERARDFFERGLESSFTNFRQMQHEDYPLAVFYAFKQSESTETAGNEHDMTPPSVSTGWETMLEGLMRAGFVIDGTWPMRTERSARSMSIGMNALASSVVLSCRHRSTSAPMATRREFLNAMKRELPDALRKLQIGNIAPVDLAQASIGPGMGVFSRYSKIVESDGSAMTVRTALTLINQVLDEVLAEQEGEFDADTRWAVAWFEQHGMEEGDFGVAEILSKAKNTSVQGLVEAGLLSSRGGKVQLLRRDELPDDWDPVTDARLAEWEATQYLIRALDQQGEAGAADLLRKLGGDYGEKARDLAYRLYSICERKGWASEALAYNSLVIAWSEISKLAQQAPAINGDTGELFE